MNMECIEWKAAELVVVVSTGAVIVVVRVRVRSAFNEGAILLRGVETHKGGSSPIIRISYIAAFHGLAIGFRLSFRIFRIFPSSQIPCYLGEHNDYAKGMSCKQIRFQGRNSPRNCHRCRTIATLLRCSFLLNNSF
jgi:hypothetical protein